MVKDTGKEYVT